MLESEFGIAVQSGRVEALFGQFGFPRRDFAPKVCSWKFSAKIMATLSRWGYVLEKTERNSIRWKLLIGGWKRRLALEAADSYSKSVTVLSGPFTLHSTVVRAKSAGHWKQVAADLSNCSLRHAEGKAF